MTVDIPDWVEPDDPLLQVTELWQQQQPWLARPDPEDQPDD